MSRGLAAVVVLAILATLFSAAFYKVSEIEQVIITQFGEPKGGAITTPGPHFKVPFIQKVNRFDKRWLEWDGNPEQVPTREKTYILVDIYARWRIADPLKFFVAVRDERNAQSRIDDILDNATRNIIAGHDLIEVVRSSNRAFVAVEPAEDAAEAQRRPEVKVGRAKLAEAILAKAQEAMPDFGIELVDVQFQRVNYSQQVQRKIFERMISERKRIAELYRSQGEGERNFVLGRKERELRAIESEAYRKAQEVKGAADAKATAIYAEAHRLDPGLYKMLKSLESYRAAIDGDSVLLLSTDSEYLAPLVGR